MARRLVRKRAAERDLADQVERIARERPASARRYLLALEDTFARLLKTPEVGAKRELDNPALEGLRMWPVAGFPKFLIFYRVTKTRVEIIRVLHGARDIARILGGER